MKDLCERKKEPKEKDIFERKPKAAPRARPQPKKGADEEEGVFDATKGKIREGGLRRALRVEKDYKFKRPELMRLLKIEVGSKFDFGAHTIKMTEKLQRQLQLAVNMLK